MKLGAFVFVVSAVAATGCAARPSATTATVPTSTTRLTAAEVPVAQTGEDAPRVGKQQNAAFIDGDAEKSPVKDGRHGDRRTGGGFSGYK